MVLFADGHTTTRDDDIIFTGGFAKCFAGGKRRVAHNAIVIHRATQLREQAVDRITIAVVNSAGG